MRPGSFSCESEDYFPTGMDFEIENCLSVTQTKPISLFQIQNLFEKEVLQNVDEF